MFQYTGRERDADSGLYYYRARYYDPSIGRFLTEDPLGFAAGINFYAYVDNNPINANDPTGEFAVLGPGLVAGGIAGGAVLLNGGSWQQAAGAFTGGFVMGTAATVTGAYAVITGTALRLGFSPAGSTAVSMLTVGGGGSAMGDGVGQTIVAQLNAVTGQPVAAWNPQQTTNAFMIGTFAGAPSALVGFAKAIGIPVETTLSMSTAFATGKAAIGTAWNHAFPPNDQPANQTSSSVFDSGNMSGMPNFSQSLSQYTDINVHGAGSNPAGGGFVIYPNKPNLNMMQAVYSK